MALVSPGIQVSVTDQSNYVPSSNGTVPYILLATAENKSAPGGGVATGTLGENAGKLYAITSQRDLVTTFGSPAFQTTASGSAINGSELNEYGLLAAYSALGVSNQVFVQRADIDLSELEGSANRPTGEPSDGSFWVDTKTTAAGLYRWELETGKYTAVAPLYDTEDTDANSAPSSAIGSIGDYLVKAAANPMTTWYKAYDNNWVLLSSPEWQLAIPTVPGYRYNPTVTAAGSITINTITITLSIGQSVDQVASAINAAMESGGQGDAVFARVKNRNLLISATQFAASDGTNADGAIAITGTPSLLTEFGIPAGKYYAAAVQHSSYYIQPEWFSFDATPRPTGSIWVKTSQVGNGADFAVKRYSTATKQWTTLNVNNYYSNGEATYANDPVNGGLNIAVGTVWAKYNVAGDGTDAWNLWYRKNTGATVATATIPATSSITGGNFVLQVSQPGASGYSVSQSVTISANTTPVGFVAALTTLAIPYVQVTLNSDNRLVVSHTKGGDVRFADSSGDVLSSMGITSATNTYLSGRGTGTDTFIATNWAPLRDLGYYVSNSQPYAAPNDGALWYWNSPTHLDIMINDGTAWRGYRNVGTDIRGYDLSVSNPNGVIIQSSAPATRQDGNNLTYGDLWLDTSDLENFPRLYRYQNIISVDTWVLIDNTDNVSQNGILFADARWSTSGSVDPVFDPVANIAALTLSDYTDLDVPDPALYPRGMLLWNTRASSYNVKKYVENYFIESAYPNEVLPEQRSAWVTVSGFQNNSVVPDFGRFAQRSVVVAAMKSAIDSSSALREEQNVFNLLACPGYPELISNMLSLNNDRNNTGFVIGDSPLRLQANGTDIIAWAQNSSNQTQNNEKGLVSQDPYLAVYYPSGKASDLSGNAVVVPASHAVIRTYIRSDNSSYPWFAPAGTRRGVLDNVSGIGFIDSASGAFVSVGITQGLRDVMYNNKINPITYLPGAGLVCYGNKTTATSPSALDRINVARLINYVRTQLDILARPYIFEPNDPITRKQIKAVVESLLNDIVAKRGITDYLVVCDDTNNTSDRIARNELYVDVAVQPTKDVEFIYIPIRLKNPGEIESGNVAPAQSVGTGA